MVNSRGYLENAKADPGYYLDILTTQIFYSLTQSYGGKILDQLQIKLSQTEINRIINVCKITDCSNLHTQLGVNSCVNNLYTCIYQLIDEGDLSQGCIEYGINITSPCGDFISSITNIDLTNNNRLLIDTIIDVSLDYLTYNSNALNACTALVGDCYIAYSN